MSVPKDMFSGLVYKSNNYGKFEIVQYVSKLNVLIRFLNTGHETVVSSSNVRKGKVKDKSVRTVYGVGFFGEGKHKTRINNAPSPAYIKWVDMMRRCNDKSHKSYKYYADCVICDEWHNFQNFAEWYFANAKNDGLKYELDKDINGNGSKVYSPETCLLVSRKDNAEKASAKNYRFKNPDGVVVEIYNLNEFCKNNGLLHSHMYAVHSGDRRSHAGWTAAE